MTRDLEAPWYSGTPSFFRAPSVGAADVAEGTVGILGLPIDEFATTVGRTGMRWGPRRIREASLRLSLNYGRSSGGILDVRSGRVTVWPDDLVMVDAGDAPVVYHDPSGQIEAATQYVSAVAQKAGVTVSLGGDHSVAYPAFAGVSAARMQQQPGTRFGYLHIDSHTDFVDERLVIGRYSHASCARRISELPGVERMAWFGLNGMSEPGQFDTMRDRGFKAFTSHYIHRVGVERAMSEAIEYLSDGTDELYVSIDIDVVNNAHAPATGAAVFEGLSAAEFLQSVRLLASVDNIVGIDMCEVAPELDNSWRTETLAAQAILSLIGSRVLAVSHVVPANELQEVFLV